MGLVQAVHLLVRMIVLRLRNLRSAESVATTRGNSIMTRGLIVLVAAATMAAAIAPAQAGGNGGAVAAGVIGGLAVGGMLGAAAAQPRYAPAPVYVAPPPAGP